MAKAWGHSHSGIDGIRPHLITALAGGRGQLLQPVSASSAKPQWPCAAEFDDEVDWPYMMRGLGYEGELFLLLEEGPGGLLAASESMLSTGIFAIAVFAGAFTSLQLQPHGLLKCGEPWGVFIQHFQGTSLCITDKPSCPIEFVECQNY